MPKELELLNEWAERLGIGDWMITLETNVKPENMSIKDADGCVDYIETIKAAKIQIVDESKRSEALRPFDFEETLVHELLHLKLALLAEGDNWDNKLQLRVLHIIIDDLSRAFIKAKRCNNEQGDFDKGT